MNTTRLVRFPSGHEFELNRRMGKVLHELHQHRPFASFDVEKTFHPQQVRPTQRHQGVHRFSRIPATASASLGQHKTADTVGVRGVGNEGVALIGSRFDKPRRIELPIDRLQNLGPGIEGAQSGGQRAQCAVAGDICLRDDETVGEYRLLARLGRPFKRVSSGDGVDDRYNGFDMKRSAEGAIGRESLENGAGIGQSTGLDSDTAEVRQFAALALDNHAA